MIKGAVMQTQFTLREAKARLSELLDRVAAGETVEITRKGAKKGRFRITSIEGEFGRRPGAMAGRIVISPTFDDEDAEILADFEGRE